MADGSTKPVHTLKQGDVVKTGIDDGTAVVKVRASVYT